ncbi:MAG: DUF58 domain-containing protein [Candidatus Kapabacteria bacterium]|jgi:uncharacterized protein (DUF58 family)|nr:DUF58 domain-containing protein [Candidatus Kapabacteria bacterium]
MSTPAAPHKPDVIARLGTLELRARKVVEGFITGLHRSPFHGFSAEFSEHRQYRMGDELKHIDWRIFGRTDRFYVKQFEDETNLRCTVVVDSSASMSYASNGNVSKFHYATTLAACIMYVMLRQRDAAGLAVYDTSLHTYLPARSRLSWVQQLLSTLATVEPSKGTATAEALHVLAEQLGRRGMVVLISDLFDDPLRILQALQHFRHNKHDVLVMHVVDRREIDFDFPTASVFRDIETGEELSTQPAQIKRSYRQAMDEFCAAIRKGCHDQNVDYVRIATDTPYDVALREYLLSRRSIRG